MMDLERYLLTGRNPQRVLEVIHARQIADSYFNNTARHEHGQAFVGKIWPLLERYIRDDESVSKDEVKAVCNGELDHLQKSAMMFCEEAFRMELLAFDESKDSPSDKGNLAWRYRELASYLNQHQELVTKDVLDWAYFCYHLEMILTLEIPEDHLKEMIDGIDAEEIKNTYHNKEYFNYGGSYLDVPQWIGFLMAYLEFWERYDLISTCFKKMKYPELQDALGYCLGFSETCLNLIDTMDGDETELGLVLLGHWRRLLVRNYGVLKAYNDLYKGHELFKKGYSLLDEREKGLEKEIGGTIEKFTRFLGRDAVERWYFEHEYQQGLVDSAAKSASEEIEKLMRNYLDGTFDGQYAKSDYLNYRYLIYLCEHCEVLRDKGLADVVAKGYETFLSSKEVYRLPEFGEELLEFIRGFILPMRVNQNYEESYQVAMSQYLVLYEGITARVDETYNERAIRESIVLASLLLLSEDDNILEGKRHEIFWKVMDHLVRQICSCWMDHLQAYYLNALKTGYLVACQIWKKDKTDYERLMIEEVESMYMLEELFDVAEDEIEAESKKMMKERWEDEKEVMKIRAGQIHEMNRWNRIEKWMGEM